MAKGYSARRGFSNGSGQMLKQEQMQQQMAEDDGKMYWVDNAEVPEWNFDKITDETSFYLDSDGHLVICFNEGDVAPMYMGCVQFVIPDEVVADIRK